MEKISFLLLLLLLSIYSYAQQEQVESILSQLPDVAFKKLDRAGDYAMFELSVKQPLDHTDTSKGFFSQKVYLSHKAFDLPMVMVTAGYNVNRNRISELTNLLEANQIIVEHRYFGSSMPNALDYRFLNLKQATADLHKLRKLFTDLYESKWVSTGISKGGATTIFYRYFYPDDVNVSVPYVAPINKSYEEQRIYDFLDTIGTKVCRDKISAFQIRVLENRDQLIPLLKFYSIGARVRYSYLSLSEAFEYAVMEYPFSFWQWGHDCANIPTKTATIEELAEHLILVSDPTFFGDEAIRQYTSHYYQSATEMGYYGYETSAFKDYLKELPSDSNPMALFFPFNMADKFNGQLLDDINRWLETNGDQFAYIYGGIDTWSASAVPPNDKVDAEWFFLKGKHHGNARIRSMSPVERKRFIAALEKWLSIKITPIKWE